MWDPWWGSGMVKGMKTEWHMGVHDTHKRLGCSREVGTGLWRKTGQNLAWRLRGRTQTRAGTMASKNEGSWELSKPVVTLGYIRRTPAMCLRTAHSKAL